MSKVAIQVAAAAITDAAGRILLSRRPSGVHQGGLWEFPGGKLEPGESAVAGLRRELEEELGIRPLRARPLICVTHAYGDRTVALDVWRVDAYQGEAHGRQGQPLVWCAVEDLPSYPMPAADRPVVAALRLPDRYLITPDPGLTPNFLAGLERSLQSGIRLVQLRGGSPPGVEPERFAREVRRLCRDHGAALLINGAPSLAQALGADGVHLPARRLLRLSERPLGARHWVAASCHDATELRQAARCLVDFAVLSPVLATSSHPGARPLGWQRFGALVRLAGMPTYALGGLGAEHLEQAKAQGALGVAAIRGLWNR